ncbi:MAG: DUF882 domain-containing protein [Deltaproteobacteria bacterium]|nr:DUF882 domain-containing protein [Deltaproteobacteria bacterium]
MGDLTKNFSRREFACKCGCGWDDIDLRLVEALQRLRDLLGRPVYVLSGCRCPKHNREVGGARFSYHMPVEGRNTQGMAADVYVRGMPVYVLAAQAQQIQEFRDGGIGRYEDSGFVHLDIRGYPARW